MDSILSQAINMSQTSKHFKVVAADVADAGTYTYDIPVPKGAYVDKVTCLVKTLFDHGTSSSIQVGDLNDADKFLVATDLQDPTAAGSGSEVAAAIESAIAQRMLPVSASTDNDAGESRYTIRATITVAGTAATAGEVWFWVDYRFDANVAYA